ncbi:MAG TPA: hypothetical protein VG406_30130 [Isosphaeraceae bacterium]|jgi:hypothetical protein|nr:hypothetical protein [Isosphaeraceae bacterium]
MGRQPRRPRLEGLESRELLTTGYQLTPDGPVGPFPLVDGRTAQILPSPFPTVAPRVLSSTLLPRLGQVLITFVADPAGINQASLATSSNYSLVRLHGTSGLNLTITSAVVAQPSAGGTQTVTLNVGGNAPLPRGVYALTVVSGGIRDNAGVPLDGEFTRFLPSGDGHPGGNFQSLLLTNGPLSFTEVPTAPFIFFGFTPEPHHTNRSASFRPRLPSPAGSRS